MAVTLERIMISKQKQDVDLLIKKASHVLPVEVFLVYGCMHTGGIETLILRLSDYLVKSGFSTTLFCTPGGELQSSLNAKVNVKNYNDIDDLVEIVKSNPCKNSADRHLVILSFDATSAARALMVEMAMAKLVQVVHITGVFHPKWYFMLGQPLDRILLNYLLSYAIGKKNIFFMNEECRIEHAKKWRSDLSICPVLPLPISLAALLWTPLVSSSVRIVSIGRLVDFKTYNLGAARIVRDCLDRGLSVSWDIYGYGPLEAQMMAEVKKSGVSQHVRLMGKLKYEDFSVTVATYDLFVGMGTAAVEAAIVGVPTICAVVEEATGCYGYFCDLPFGNVGEAMENTSLIEIADMVESFSSLDIDGRRLISGKCVTAAKLYGMSTFMESLMAMAASCGSSSNWIRKYFIGKFYCLMTDGLLAKVIYGRGLKTKIMRIFRS